MSELEDLDELGGAPLELTLEFRRQPDGTKEGRIVVRNASGRTLADLPQESPEAMIAALARLVVLAFEDHARTTVSPEAARRRTAPRVERIAADVLVTGVDGYRKGWVAVALDPSGDVDVSTHPTFAEVLASRAQVIPVDIPIDPIGRGARPTDAAARAAKPKPSRPSIGNGWARSGPSVSDRLRRPLGGT